jgi:hypothetical protein
MELSYDEAVLVASRAGLDPAAPFAIPRDQAAPTREEER